MKIETVHFSDLNPADWRANYTFRPEVRMLADSILAYGWLTPLVVMNDGTIVDGTTRWTLAKTNKKILKRDSGLVPVTRFDGDVVDAMLAHVRLNRAKGEIIPKFMSGLVIDVVRSGKFTVETLQKELHLGSDEISLLLEGTLFKTRGVSKHSYSQAWVPIEAETIPVAPVFERPPNKDS